jgi:GxxExxY protein
MNTDPTEVKEKELTEKIIGIFYKVFNALGYGSLEKVYENAMNIELERERVPVISQAPIKVSYEGKVVGEYFADMLVDGKVIVEIRAGHSLAPEHEAQLLNYLKATDAEVGLLPNFGPKPQVKREVFDNIRKK